jgi:hypothetical protein
MCVVKARDELESLLRGWGAHETGRGVPAIIDYDCAPGTTQPTPVTNRLDVLGRLTAIAERAADDGNGPLVEQVGAHVAYVRALLGEVAPLDAYVRATQGCGTAGWPADYVSEVGDRARQALAALGVPWGPDTETALTEVEGPVDPADVPDGMRQAATDMEAHVRRLTGADAPYTLAVEAVDVDAYWSYWLDGAGPNVRLRLNMTRAAFTRVRLRQFALHEILGHGLQSANWAAASAGGDAPWVRLSSVHGPNQVLLEGLAQVWPLFAYPDDEPLAARVRLDHYAQLVRAELHRAINAGQPAETCAAHAHARVPYWTDDTIADYLTDRAADPLLRSYLWAYPAGIDWFVHLADHGDPASVERVLHAAYSRPLTPDDLARLWPAGPIVGGPGAPIRVRHPVLP